MLPVALTIAGSDPSGGAGIQADLKTFAAYRVYGMAVVTALTAQNTRGVFGTHVVPGAFLRDQLTALLDDVQPGAAKTGMLPSREAVEAVASTLARVPGLPLVVDPVLVSTSGHALADATTLGASRDLLFPIATLITPNLAEAGALLGTTVRSRADMGEAARALLGLGPRAALVTGGHLEGSATDVLCTADGVVELDGPRIGNVSAHGTGCTLAAAIAAGIALGRPLVEAIRTAKEYVTRALAHAQPIGGGLRVLDHGIDPPPTG